MSSGKHRPNVIRVLNPVQALGALPQVGGQKGKSLLVRKPTGPLRHNLYPPLNKSPTLVTKENCIDYRGRVKIGYKIEQYHRNPIEQNSLAEVAF